MKRLSPKLAALPFANDEWAFGRSIRQRAQRLWAKRLNKHQGTAAVVGPTNADWRIALPPTATERRVRLDHPRRREWESALRHRRSARLSRSCCRATPGDRPVTPQLAFNLYTAAVLESRDVDDESAGLPRGRYESPSTSEAQRGRTAGVIIGDTCSAPGGSAGRPPRTGSGATKRYPAGRGGPPVGHDRVRWPDPDEDAMIAALPARLRRAVGDLAPGAPVAGRTDRWSSSVAPVRDALEHRIVADGGAESFEPQAIGAEPAQVGSVVTDRQVRTQCRQVAAQQGAASCQSRSAAARRAAPRTGTSHSCSSSGIASTCP